MSRTATAVSPSRSPWEPLRIPIFRYLWLANLVSHVGTWMREVGAGWLMTSLSDSTVMVALVQTATSLPAFFILLPSGALSDILDRRLYLLSANIGMAITALAMGVLTVTGQMTDWMLLGLIFLMGVGTAVIMPTWQAIVPEVVPRSELHGAIALNTMGMNVSRVVGSLVAGLVVAASGSGAVFMLNAATFIFIIYVLATWKRSPPQTRLPPERFASAIRTGLRYTRHSPALKATIYRGIGFYFFASVMWALLPLVARDLLDGGPRTYSALFAAISVGAVISALLMPRWRARLDNDKLITLSSWLFAAGIALTALVPNLVLALLALGVCGAAWITVMTCAQVSAQTALPNWVRSRGLAIFLTFFMGSLAIGPFVWGNIAEMTSLPASMLIAAAGLAAASLVTLRWPVSGNDKLDLSPSGHWKPPAPVTEIAPRQGPVMVTVRYQVEAHNVDAFLALVERLGIARRRDGAHAWGLVQDTTRADVYLEYYLVETWLDHLRQHERISRQDEALQAQIRALLVEGKAPVVTHYVTPASRSAHSWASP